MNFSEGSYYKLQKDYYEHIKLLCVWVEYSYVYFKYPDGVGDNRVVSIGADYKLELKTNKLYKWNDKFIGWDTVENMLSEYGVEDIWNRVESYQFDLGKGD